MSKGPPPLAAPTVLSLYPLHRGGSVGLESAPFSYIVAFLRPREGFDGRPESGLLSRIRRAYDFASLGLSLLGRMPLNLVVILQGIRVRCFERLHFFLRIIT